MNNKQELLDYAKERAEEVMNNSKNKSKFAPFNICEFNNHNFTHDVTMPACNNNRIAGSFYCKEHSNEF